jgi:mycofactocin system transcriptional regulator
MVSAGSTDIGDVRPGRRPSTSHADLARVGMRLFIERGFDETTVDDIAEAAGIGRRTFFRYFASKNDIPWGDFDVMLERMRRFLAEVPADVSLVEALRLAIVEFNRLEPGKTALLRQRMTLVLTVPSLIAHSTLRYAAWREVIAEYVARRRDVAPDSLEPQAIAWAFLGVSLAAYKQWLRDEDADLSALLNEAIRLLGGAFDLEARPSPDAGAAAR